MPPEFLRILNELHDHHVDFVIVGGIAVALHGGSRATFDLDIVPSLAPDSWQAAVDLLWSLGARPRIPEPLEQIRDAEQVRRWRLDKNMLALNFHTPPSRRRKRSDVYFALLAERRSFDRLAQNLLGRRTWIREPSDLRNHDDRAAFVCALTALSVAAGDFTAVGDERDGWIILPPQWAFANWAWTAARETARREQLERSESPGRLLSFPENQPATGR